jgi:protocatechuate 3,4-dioxygenase beta subunit
MAASRRFEALVILGLSVAWISGADKPARADSEIRILFLGNSLTAGNDLPAMVQAMAQAGGVRVACQARTPGGASLEDQWQDGAARQLLAATRWDYLVLQQGPSSRPESQVHLRKWTAKWADEARKHGTKPALFMVWPFQRQASGFNLVSESYRRAAAASSCRLLPAGEAWEKALRDKLTVSLYQADELHPTKAGTYLAALVITYGLTGVRPSAVPSKLILAGGQVVEFPDEQAEALRQTAEKSAEAANQTRFTQPPGEETDEVKRLIDQAKVHLEAGKSTTEILTDVAYLPTHEYPRFRRLIRDSAQSSQATIVTPKEPGSPLVASGRVIGDNGKPLMGASVYVNHTSAKGWYSDRAAHISAHEGDRKHARLFGYMKTAGDGRFEIHTIRPSGYPDSDLPAHIHVEIQSAGVGAGSLATEIQFDDDPRLTPAWRHRSQQEGFHIAKVDTDSSGVQHVNVEIRMRR